MDVLLVEPVSVAVQIQSLLESVAQLRSEVAELRTENSELRRQVSELRREVGYWKSRHADAVQRNNQLQAELDQAQAEIRQLTAERFGKQSEKQSAADRSNQLDDPRQAQTPQNKRGQQPGRPAPKRRDYSHLPVRGETVDVPDDAKLCGCCGKPLEDLGSNDDGEQIDIETVIYRKVVRRKRYRRTCECRQQPHTVTAPMTPIYEVIRAHHVQSSYFHADETRWHVFAEKAGKTGHRWWLWLFAGEDSVVYVLDPSRSHDVPQSHFPDDAQGVLMVDRYSGYKAMQQVKDGKLLLAFCWAHVRRDFVRVGKGFPEFKTWALQWLGSIRELYRLNRERLRHPAKTAEFAAVDARLREQLASLVAQRDAELSDEKLREPSRKTLVSLSEHWSGLTLFVNDPRIPLDNNYGERLIRNPAVGRKNYYGSGSEWSGRLAMMMFSIFATLVLWKINPRTWLNWYFAACAAKGGQAADHPESFLPWNLSEGRLTELRNSTLSDPPNTS